MVSHGWRLPSLDRRVWILFVGMALNQFGMSIVMPFVSIYLFVYQGMPATLVGFAMFFSTFVGALFQFIGGEACDRFGRRSVFIAGLLLLIVSFLLLGWAVSIKAPYLYYLAFLSLTRIAVGLFKPLPNIIAADIVPPGQRMEAFGVLRIATNVGFATGPVVGGLMALLSYSSMFYLTAVTSTCYLIMVLLFIGDTRTCRREESPRAPVSAIAGDRPFMVFAILTFAVAIVYSQMYSPLSMYSGLVGLTEPEVGLLFAINGLMVVVAQYFVTLVTDRYRMTLSMGFGTLLYAIGFGLVAASHSFPMLAICIFIITVGELCYQPPLITLTANLSGGSSRGRYLGFSGLMGTLGFAIGPLIGGFLLDHFKAAPWIVWAVVCVSGLLCAAGFIYLRKLVPPEKNTATLVET
ncbi:MAG: putative transporter [Methanocella sp. PtaU1.Bin125]|nr:MAG: putative transporter [Methanocella sp. PtaU1.Bin125]